MERKILCVVCGEKAVKTNEVYDHESMRFVVGNAKLSQKCNYCNGNIFETGACIAVTTWKLGAKEPLAWENAYLIPVDDREAQEQHRNELVNEVARDLGITIE